MGKKMTALCSCGTRLKSPNAMQFHLSDGVWHAVAREARALKKLGLSYSEVARQLKGRASKPLVWMRLREEGL